jgi:hypothetical protein
LLIPVTIPIPVVIPNDLDKIYVPAHVGVDIPLLFYGFLLVLLPGFYFRIILSGTMVPLLIVIEVTVV